MFSGDRNYPTQWALNPSAYQNMSNDQVDWAALAQQWIMMKETCPPEQVPPAPPPPSIGPVKKKSVSSNSGNSLIEAGEAPMEVENDKDDGDDEPPASWTGPATGPGSWNWEQQQWGWNSNWSGNASSSASPSIVAPTGGKAALLPTPFGFPDVSNSASYSGYASGLWSGDNTRSKSKQKHRESDDEQMNSTIALDAAKRRQLPAWIREGLEKMEREKQKQIDKEREAREREEFLKLKKQEAEEVRKVMTDSGLVVLPSKSKFESDSEESEKEDIVEVQKIAKRDDQETIMRSKSKEERLQDVMLQVRRMMTEILLDVTTTEIEQICQEELKRNRASASAMNLQKTPALASLTGKLGLGIYGESASSDSDTDHSNPDDSDSYLKETIRRRKAEFARTEREIDARAQEVERRQAEQDREDQPTKSSNPTKDVERYNQVEPTNSHGLLEHKTVPVRKSRFHDAAEPHTIEIKKQTETKQKSSSSSQSSESSSESSHRSYKPKRDRHRRGRDSRSVSSVRSVKESNGNNKRTRKGYSRSRSREYSRKRSVSREYYRSRSRSHRRSRSRSKHSYRRSRSRDQRRHRSRSRDYNRSSQRRSRSRERGKRSYRH